MTWPDGSLHWLKDQGKVFPGPDGRPLFMTGACVDITERVRAEEELREADRRKDEFLACSATSCATHWPPPQRHRDPPPAPARRAGAGAGLRPDRTALS